MLERQHLAGKITASKMLAFLNKNNADFFYRWRVVKFYTFSERRVESVGVRFFRLMLMFNQSQTIYFAASAVAPLRA